MNDLQKLYDVLKRDGYYTKTFEEFQTQWQDKAYKDKVYSVVSRDRLYTKSKEEFFSKYSGSISKQPTQPKLQDQEPVKKKEPTVSASKLEKPTSVSSSKEANEDIPNVASNVDFTAKGAKESNIYTGYPGKAGKRYKFQNGAWYEESVPKQSDSPQIKSIGGAIVKTPTQKTASQASSWKPITDVTRVSNLNKHFGKEGSTSPQEKIYFGYQGKEKNEYRVKDGTWQRRQPGKKDWTTITNEGSINALNKEYGKSIKPMSEQQKSQVVNQAKRDADLEQRLNQVVTGNLVSQDALGARFSSDDAVAERLRQSFPGFEFTAQGGMSDRVNVVAPNGATMELKLDNWTWDGDKEEAEGLKTFIRINSNADVTKASQKIDSIQSQRKKEIDVATNKLAAENLLDRTQKFLEDPLAPVDPMELVKKVQEGEKIAKPIYQKYQAPLKEAKEEYVKAKAEQFRDVYEMTRADKSIDPKQAYAAIRRDDRDIKIIGDYYNNVQKSAVDFDKKKKEEQVRINQLAQKVKSGEMTMDEYEAIIQESNTTLAAEAKEIAANLKSVSTASKALDKSIGMNYVIEESRGSFGGGMAYKFVEGLTSIPRLLSFGDMSKEDQDNLVKAITGGDTSTQYVESSKRGDLAKSMFSLAESLGVMASSAPFGALGSAARYAGFYGMSYYEMKDQLDGAKFYNKETGEIEKIPETDKVLLSAGYGVLSSVLENFGIDMALSKTAFGKNLANNIMKRAFLDLPKEATEAEIRAAINSSVTNILNQMGVKAAIGASAEALTEASQSLAQVGIEEVYDEFKGKNFSKNKGLQDVLSNAAYEGYLGAIGGGVMSIAQSSPKALQIGFNSVYKKEELEALINATKIEGINSALVNSLKADLLTGKMTSEEAKSIINSFNTIQGKVRSMPDNLSPEAKAESLELMMERERLDKEKEGKDPNLVKPQVDRINDINNRLQEIAQENAVQEQATSEVPVQPEAGVGGEVAQGAPETTTEQVTEEGEQAVEEEVVPTTEITEEAQLEAEPVETVQEEVQVEEALAPEVQEELDAFEQLLSDEGLAFEEVVDEEAAAMAPEVEEEVVVPAPPSQRKVSSKTPTQAAPTPAPTPAQQMASDEDIMLEEDLVQEVENSKQNIEEAKQRANEAIAKVNASKWSKGRKKTEIDKIKAKRDEEIADSRDYLNGFKRDLDKVRRRINKANAQQPAAPKPTQKKKQTAKQAKEQFIAEVDAQIKRERDITGMKLAELENQRMRAYRNGNNQLGRELADKIEDERLASRKRLADLNAKKDNPSAFARFRKRTEGEVEAQDERNDREIIAQHMEETLSEEDKALESPESMSSEVTIDPIKESKSLSKSISKVLNFLGIKDKNELLINIEDLVDIPMGMAMSDTLAGGDIVDSMGNKMNVGGGLLFNLFNNIKLAWAGVKKSDSDKMYKEAYDNYIGHKELFERLWAEGRLPYGHVPIAVMRMGNTAINSNEAVFRYALPYIQSLPLENRKAALQELLNQFDEKTKGESSTYWKNELLEAISNGEVKTEEELKSYIQRLVDDKKNKGRSGKAKKFLNVVEKLEKSGIEDLLGKTTELLNKDVNSTVIAKMASFIENNNIETLDEFFEAIIKGANERAKGIENDFSLPARAFLFSTFFSAESKEEGKTKTSGLAVVKTLLDGVENAKNEIFTADHIYKAIGEPSMQKTKQGDFVAVMGIKVLDENGNKAGGTVKADHANYGFGPEGRLIGYIRNPKQGIDVFPEFRAKLARVFKQDKNNEYPTFENAVTQTGGNFFIDSAFRGAKAKFGKITDMDVLIGKLRFAFPEVQVVTTQQEFDKFIAEEEGVRTREKNGEIIYGVTKDGRIFINPSYQSLRTPIHEFGHVWIDFLRSKASGEVGDMLLKKGFELVDGTPEYKRALKEYGDRQLALEEALVELMATKGDTLIGAAKTRFKNWMNAVFKYIKQQFTTNTEILTKLYKDKNNPDNARKAIDYINQMSLDDFINIGLADLFSGERVSDKFDARTAESASKARKSKQNIANKIVEIGREKGISDDVIKQSLKKRGYTNAEINQALSVQPDTTVAPNEALNDFIDSINTVVKEYAAAARRKVRADLKAKRAVLAAKLKAMQTSGNITAKQAQALLEKVNKLNLSNSVAVDRFMQFAENVFKNAEYVESLSTINRLLPAARRNVKSKLGIANDLVPMLQSMLAVKPSFIPMSVFDTYKSIIDIVGQRQAELELPEISELVNKVQEVTEAIDVEAGLAADLTERLENYPDKVMENGKLQYTETINKMLEDGIINEYDLSVMKKYRSMIAPTERAKKSEQELQDERDQAIVDLRSEPVDASTLPTRDERNLATKLAAFLKTDALESLSNQELNDLLKIVDNINNGFITNRAQMLVEKMDGIIKRDNLLGPIGRIKVMLGERLKSGAKKALFRKKGNFYKYILEGNSSAFIDEVFGNFKERPFYDNIFKPIGQALAAFTAENRVVSDRIVAMEKKLAKAFGRNENKITMSKFKMMTWLIQNEFESNPNSRQVNPAIEFLKKTIKETKADRTYYSSEDVKMFEKIINDYQDVMKDENGDPILDKDGNEVMGIDMDKMYDSFNDTEKNILAEIRTINDMMSEKAEYTAAIVRGSRITPIANYISLGVINSETRNDQLDSINELRNVFGNSRTTSTRAKTLIERTGKVSAINFDPFSSVRRSASSVLMDYHLTPAVRQGRFTMRELERAVDNNEISEDKLPLVTALDAAFTQIVDTAVGNTFMSEGISRSVINEISRQGYRAVLAGVSRMTSEAMSNMAYILMKGSRSWAAGASYGKLLMSPDAFNVLKNVNSVQTNRIYSSSTVSSQLAASEIFNQTSGIKGSQAKGVVANAAKTIYNKSLKRLKNTTEATADLLMSTPDMVMIRPLWFGEFARQFKKETGADVDFEKIANNDEAYMAQYQDAINKSKDTADDTTIKAGSSDNIALGILRNTIKPDDNEVVAWYKKFNSYMAKFLLFEYQTARSGITMLMKGNKIEKAEGVALIAAVTARMMVYQLATRTLANGFVDLVAGVLGYRDDEEEEEEDDKTVMQRVGQAIASTMTTLLFGRNFGNAARVPLNYGIEKMNEMYLESLRNGEYDMYEDALQYSIVPTEKPKGDTGKGVDIMDIYINTLGSAAPAVKTLRYLGKKFTEDDKKTEDAIERQKKERAIRVPMEIAGSLGYLPLYKDVRKITMDYIYGDLDRAEKVTSKNIGELLKSEKSKLSRGISSIVKMRNEKQISEREASKQIEAERENYLKTIKELRAKLKKNEPGSGPRYVD